MSARLIFQRDGREQQQELSSVGLTIGRGQACDLQLDDDRISTQHCRISILGGEWTVQDLRSANRTFVNEELVLERPRRLADGETLRLGCADAPLFVARFTIHDQPTRSSPSTPPASSRHAELEAALQERDAELARVRALCKQLQVRLDECEARAALDAAHGSTLMREQEVLQAELIELRASSANSREELSSAQSACRELEKKLIEERQQAQNSFNEAERARVRNEHELRRARSELAVATQALAVATANVEALNCAHDDLLTRLTVHEVT